MDHIYDQTYREKKLRSSLPEEAGVRRHERDLVGIGSWTLSQSQEPYKHVDMPNDLDFKSGFWKPDVANVSHWQARMA